MRGNPDHFEKRWTREEVLAEIKEWNLRHGEPPRANQWRGVAGMSPHPDWSPGGDFPSTTTVYKMFGGWNEAILAAGFKPRNNSAQAAREAAARIGIPPGASKAQQLLGADLARTRFRRADLLEKIDATVEQEEQLLDALAVLGLDLREVQYA